MAIYTFQSYPYTATATFDCPRCNKRKRTRSFKAECTVNPFNTDESGNLLGPSQVRAQSKENALELKRQFLLRPLCSSCENNLSFEQKKEVLRARASRTSHDARQEEGESR